MLSPCALLCCNHGLEICHDALAISIGETFGRAVHQAYPWIHLLHPAEVTCLVVHEDGVLSLDVVGLHRAPHPQALVWESVGDDPHPACAVGKVPGEVNAVESLGNDARLVE